MECYCVARKKPTRYAETKLQIAMVISLWFCYSYVLNYFYCDWTLQNQHSNNQQFSGGYSFDVMGKEE